MSLFNVSGLFVSAACFICWSELAGLNHYSQGEHAINLLLTAWFCSVVKRDFSVSDF